MNDPDPREPLGRLVRETWVAWASEQPYPKASWLVGWDDLGADDREVDMRIGATVAAAERDRLRQMAARVDAVYPDLDAPGLTLSFARLIGDPDARARD